MISSVLFQLSALLSDIGLNIREAHVFSTTDGYSLDVFVVDGWPVEVKNKMFVFSFTKPFIPIQFCCFENNLFMGTLT